MTGLDRRRLTLAVLISLLLHLSVVVAPGWYLPSAVDSALSDSTAQLDARLTASPGRGTALPGAAPPVQRRKPQRDAPRPSPPPQFDTLPIELPPAVPTDLATEPQYLAAPVLAAGRVVQDIAEQFVEASPASLTLALPRQGRIRFNISRGDQGFVIGQALHRWNHDGKSYTLSNLTETTGIAAVFRPVRVMQASEGEVAGEGLRPHLFRTEKNGVAGDAASFDWLGMKLQLSGGALKEVALVAGAQDMLSMFYQFGSVLPAQAANAASSTVDRVEVTVATGRKFERYVFEIVGEEKFFSKYGELRATHLRSIAGGEATEVWLGIELHGLPLRIRYTDRQGDSFEQVADDIEFDGMQLSTRSR